MKVNFKTKSGRLFTLTDEPSKCENGLPVLLDEKGNRFGPRDMVTDGPASLSGGEVVFAFLRAVNLNKYKNLVVRYLGITRSDTAYTADAHVSFETRHGTLRGFRI